LALGLGSHHSPLDSSVFLLHASQPDTIMVPLVVRPAVWWYTRMMSAAFMMV
jgi:hypothetical protein